PPTWQINRWIKLDQAGKINSWDSTLVSYSSTVELAWSAKEPGQKCLVQRKEKGADFWATVSKWLDAGAHDQAANKWSWLFHDKTVIEEVDYIYRLKLVNATGQTAYSVEKQAERE
ncbi:MAG: hypothetical protein OEQ53_19005, partial [Saprospiraceae bacterium]|nr:hypothetical protein [Saprospiraceae bacterium]